MRGLSLGGRPPAQSKGEFTGRHMLAVMVSFFGVIIAANVIMAIFAANTWTGLVAKNGYVASIDYANDARAKQAAELLGWHIHVAAVDGFVHVSVRDDAHQPVPLDTVNATAIRHIKRDEDVELILARTATGRYRADQALPSGAWSVTSTIAGGGETLDWRVVLNVD